MDLSSIENGTVLCQDFKIKMLKKRLAEDRNTVWLDCMEVPADLALYSCQK